MLTRIETVRKTFDCPIVGRRIVLSRDMKIFERRGVAEDVRIPAGYTCSFRDECPAVATRKGATTSYDWSKCAFDAGAPV